MDDTSVTKGFVFTSDGNPSPDLSDFEPFGHIDEDRLDAWCFEPVNEAELADNWLHTAVSVAE